MPTRPSPRPRGRIRPAAVGLLLPPAALLAAACSDDPTDPGPGSGGVLALEVVASGLESPLYLTAPPGDPRLFVVEQPGRIRIVEDGSLLPTPFLDLTARVLAGGERGLLSVAFDPQYATSGRFWVAYTDAGGDVVIERYRVGADPDRADPSSAAPVLTIPQPFANHNGGHVLFGPDGMLWIASGDGGSGGDPQGNGQSVETLLGKLLRIDVVGEVTYAIPPDNPLVGETGRDEIWAWGLRNPWRIAFDETEGTLYVADVGQSAVEEVNVEPDDAAGLNYGWNVMEGDRCFEPSDCDPTGLVLPDLAYGHVGGACSVTGGIVYRGEAIPDIRGHYFYSDFCAGWVRSFRFDGAEATEHRDWALGEVGNVLSFGEDADGEMYLLAADGTVYRFVLVVPGEA